MEHDYLRLALTVGDVDLGPDAIVVGSIGSTKSDRFRRVEIGPQLTERLGDQVARRMEETALAAHETFLFVMPVRVRKGDRRRYSSADELEPIHRNTVTRDWHKQGLATRGFPTCRCTHCATRRRRCRLGPRSRSNFTWIHRPSGVATS